MAQSDTSNRALVATLIAGTALMAAWTLLLAFQVNVIWEEAHFRLIGRSIEWGYPDVPAGTPLLVALSEALFGSDSAGPRLINWALSACLPLGVYFLASGFLNQRDALLAGITSVFVPAFVTVGAYAYPEGMMQLLCVLFVGALVRAINKNTVIWWVIAGVICALGLIYHYRFWFTPFGVFIFLLATREGRALWTNPKAWLAGIIAVLGLMPTIIDNVLKDFEPIGYHAGGRQDWALWLEGLGYPLLQALAVSPLIFIALALGIWLALRQTKDCENIFKVGTKLTLITGATLALPFFAFALFDKDALPHWPFQAWAVLIVFTPLAIRWLLNVWPDWRSKAAIGFAWAIGAVMTFATGANLLLWKHAPDILEQELFTLLQGGDFENWQPVADEVAKRLDALGDDAVLVGSDHITTAILQVLGKIENPVVVLDHPNDESRNFQRYRQLRGEGEINYKAGSVRNSSGEMIPLSEKSLFVLRDPSYLYREQRILDQRITACSLEEIESTQTIDLFPGHKSVTLISGTLDVEDKQLEPSTCPALPKIVIEQPLPLTEITGDLTVYGPAASPTGVKRVEVLANGEVIGSTTERVALPGFQFPEILDFDPDYPAVFWAVVVPHDQLPHGAVQLSARTLGPDGEVLSETPERLIIVK